ncbi:unnamed protein product [Microthlaspi erraticum]|uniref:Uncharacterized protein n=1 Tax=Microthlaspi erraticum TaxID=1685480 RepID=A0A6D2HK77_9BRAS|nr:unnamed protein product [Microthlaspi erraticum]
MMRGHRCGCDVALRSTHNGKKLYVCTGNTMDGEPHLRTLWDEAVVEELAELKDDLADLDTQLVYIIQDCGRIDKLASEIEGLKESARKRDAKYAFEFKIALACAVLASFLGLTAFLS